MLSVASARPTWRTTLRTLGELTRLAVATLALAVGLGAAAPAGPPATAAQLQPTSVSSQVEVLRPEIAPVAERLTPAEAPAHRPAEPLLAAPAAGTLTATPEALPALDAGHATPGRRGPPLA
ncbi:hypothetical protein ABZ814_26315 [Micromonospora musae]|uniref:hypothetical protein n=1 Tax=Micromonospora musae TaxID=1894970 RepID=UPI0033E36544